MKSRTNEARRHGVQCACVLPAWVSRVWRAATVVSAVAMFLTSQMQGQSNVYWDVNAGTSGAGGATPSGIWSSSAVNWNTDPNGGSGAIGTWNSTLNTAIFSAGSDATGTYNVTVSGAIQLGGITVEEGNPVIGGTGSLTFAFGDGRQQVVSVASGSTAAINVGIGLSSGSLAKNGSGTLLLGANNSGLNRAILVNAGTLAVGNANALGSGTLTMASGTTLDLRNVVFSRALTLNGWTLAATTNSTSTQSGALTLSGVSNFNVDSTSQLTLSAPVGGTGALQKTGAGLLIVSGTNSFSGNTVINSGTLRVDVLGALSTGNINFTGGTLRYGTGFTTDLSQRISNSSGAVSIDTNGQNIVFGNTLISSNTGGLAKVGTGNLTLSVANSFTGATTFAGGNLVVNHVSALGSGSLTFAGGTLRYGTGITTDYSQRIANSTGAISIDTNGQNITFGNAISSTNTGGLTKLGNGTLTLSGGNAYTGNTAVSAGTLTLGANNVLADSTSVSVASGATLQVGTTETFASLSGNGTLRLTAGGNLTLSGNSSIGTLWVSGNSTLNFGSNTFSVGTFIVDPGVSFLVNNQFVAAKWWVSSTNQTNVAFDTRGTTPFNQVTITGLSGNSSLTFWQSGTNMVTVPEPSTYGAILLAGVAGVLGLRRWRKKALSPDQQTVG